MEELKLQLQKLLELTEDPHPGLSTWMNEFYNKLETTRDLIDEFLE